MNKAAYIEGLSRSDSRVLSKAISLAESQLPEHQQLALELIEHFEPSTTSKRIGITGTPGAGKSTFIDRFGSFLLTQDSTEKVAVLSIDPSSSISGGSILGDKTRMGSLNKSERVFIRPSASGSNLGGLARSTRLAMLLCEAAGYTTILIESVGVGQGETEIAQLCDLFLLVLNPGGGDELQGIKRGIVEMADLLVVNKSDGERKEIAKQTVKDYRNAQRLMPKTKSGWKPKVLECSSTEGTGIESVHQAIADYFDFIKELKQNHRLEQRQYWVFKVLQDLLIQGLSKRELKLEKALQEGVLPERIALDISKDFIN